MFGDMPRCTTVVNAANHDLVSQMNTKTCRQEEENGLIKQSFDLAKAFSKPSQGGSADDFTSNSSAYEIK
jgi:hypothetical protein